MEWTVVPDLKQTLTTTASIHTTQTANSLAMTVTMETLPDPARLDARGLWVKWCVRNSLRKLVTWQKTCAKVSKERANGTILNSFGDRLRANSGAESLISFFSVMFKPFISTMYFQWGSARVAKWVGFWTKYPGIPGSIPALIVDWSVQDFSVMLVNSHASGSPSVSWDFLLSCA